MRFHKIIGSLLLGALIHIPAGLSITSVEGSAEDIYWSAPMTVHDYEKNTDLHNIAISSLSMIELEFVRLGDGLLNFTTRSNKSPISRSMDAVEYAYSKLPQIKPVRRFGQFWDALQLRQISLSDARATSSILFVDPYGSVTSMMEVRANKLVILVEDILYDVDSAVMLPFNWSLSSLRNKPTKIKSLGFVADGLDALRQGVFKTLNYIDHRIVRFGSDTLFGIKKIQDTLIRHERKKKHGNLLIYAKMPSSIFKENLFYFTDKKKKSFVGTVPEWQARLLRDPEILPDNVQQAGLPFPEIPSSQNPPKNVIVAAEYKTWEKVPRELKKYVITLDEVQELIHP